MSPTVSSEDHRLVTHLLGREPAGEYDVVVRDGEAPVVIRNAPLLYSGRPMPTRYWLVGSALRRLIGALEADGGVRKAEMAADPDELVDAHHRYASERDAAIPADHSGPRPSGGVGGTRRGVKCLHAHYAWYLAGGDDPVGRWVASQLAATESSAQNQLGTERSDLRSSFNDDVRGNAQENAL